ncbi:WS/DGAT domain-containing protein [Rhodococcoides fascians]|uniref:WS/DGAT domain-containing protein n=1 Tax=Rhodococcoides fascians TaxID=1828 RepID=UPI00068B454F|nr:WS/DGAT domain-containing protein [Rhodococcus fascians]
MPCAFAEPLLSGSARLHPVDAQAYWMASKVPSDQFLLYCFEGAREPLESTVRRLRIRSAGIEVLGLRITEVPFGLERPHWTAMDPGTDTISVHPEPRTWQECLDAVASSFERQVDPRHTVWHLHLYPNVSGAPACDGPSLVAVLQLSHAAADGTLAARTARELFGTQPVPSRPVTPTAPPAPLTAAVAALTLPVRVVRMARAGIRARRDALRLEEHTASGSVPPPARSRALTTLDVAPTDRTDLRTIVLPKSALQFADTSITVTALTAISVALQRFLGDSDDASADLAAEVTVARTAAVGARNNFGNVGVGLFSAEPDLRTRSRLVAADLAERRARAGHPVSLTARASQNETERHVPAFLAAWGVAQFDPTAVPPTVTGNTVVSSVSRGAADLTLGGGPVRFTAGFPALSPAMSLTHGVHGIGDTVAISVTSNRAAVPDPDRYEILLRDGLDDVRTALS